MTYMTFNESDLAGRNAWFRECRDIGIPCVMVLVGHKGKATVDWDCWTVSNKHDEAIRKADEDDETLKHFYWASIARASRLEAQKCMASGGAFQGQVTGLDLATAKSVAAVVAEHLQGLTMQCRESAMPA